MTYTHSEKLLFIVMLMLLTIVILNIAMCLHSIVQFIIAYFLMCMAITLCGYMFKSHLEVVKNAEAIESRAYC